jgi:hypothetical protein
MSLFETLRDDVATGHALVIVGTGVSIAVSGGAESASWGGLLRSGIDYAAEMNLSLPEGWKAGAIADLEMAEGGLRNGFITLADKVTAALGGAGGMNYRAWLRAELEPLPVANAALAEAVVGLGLPIATTNYDGLLEKVSDREHCTWRDPGRIQRVLSGRDDAILHLHGHWAEPDSIILGSASYSKVADDLGARAIREAIAATRSLLFIGMGAGVDDPTFSTLRIWITSALTGTEVRSYRLCLDSEAAQLAVLHADEPLTPVPYGQEHSDLHDFLKALAPASSIQPTRQRSSRQSSSGVDYLTEAVRTQSVLADHMHDIDKRSIKELLIPPVLLPVSHEQFVQAAAEEEEEGNKLERCDPEATAGLEGCVLVVGDENSGVTSTLQWLAGVAAGSDHAPVVVDFRRLGSGHRPLEREVRRELLLASALTDRRDSMPRLVLALDNMSTRPDKIFARTVAELPSMSPERVFIGCREGVEADLAASLAQEGLSVTIRYVGRLSHRDVARMIDLVDPIRGAKIASSIMNATAQEHLARTPFAVGLLASVLLHGENLVGTGSQTALIDAYLNLLLGRGDPHDDARFDLDSMERSDILATLAEQFVRQNTGSLSEADVIAHLAEYFDQVSWNEDPVAVMTNLVNRRVLLIRDGQVRFAQNAYLYVFAAKSAIEDRDFLEFLCDRALHYAPIVQHYAALKRNDADLVRRLSALFTPHVAVPEIGDGSPFGPESAHSRIMPTSSLGELVEQLEMFHSTDSGDGGSAVQENVEERWLDDYEDTGDSREPFPLDDITLAAPAVQLANALSLVSRVIRDSEMVKDVELKRAVLFETLQLWGRFVEMLATDAEQIASMVDLAERIADGIGIPDERRVRFIDDFSERAPFFVAFTGLSITLSSKKLLLTLEACFDNPEFTRDPRGVVMGAVMAFDLQQPGWPRFFRDLYDLYPNMAATHTLIGAIGLGAHRVQQLLPRDESVLRDVLVDQMVDGITFPSGQAKKRARDRVSQQLRRARMTSSHEQLPPGETVLSIAPESEELDLDSDA